MRARRRLQVYFNSRPSARGDEREPDDDGAGNYLNSRPSARGDRACRVARTGLVHFNSRPSARGDPDGGVARRNRRVISIHAPPRGATSRRPGFRASGKFQFTPLREGRLVVKVPICRATDFNSRPSARGDSAQGRQATAGSYFNSRPSARGDPFRVCCRRSP